MMDVGRLGAEMKMAMAGNRHIFKPPLRSPPSPPRYDTNRAETLDASTIHITKCSVLQLSYESA